MNIVNHWLKKICANKHLKGILEERTLELNQKIEQLEQIESALKSSEERFRLMANSSPIMIWITDENGLPTFSNQVWLDFVGLSAEEVTYQAWRKLVHPDDVKTAFVNYFIDVEEHKTVSTEYRLRHVSGEWRWVFDQGVAMFNDLGVFTGYIGSLIDITARKNTETELGIAAIAFESNEAIIITDTNSVILRANKAFLELTGYSAEECIGRKTNFLKSEHHTKEFYKTMWETISNEGVWEGEIWDRRKNGEVFIKWLMITAVKNKAGIVTNYVGIQTDITARKAADKKMRDLAYYDALTKLPNRRLFFERLEHCISMAQRENKQFAILMLDLDKFKAVNDNFGHLSGDELLQQVAVRISACLRESDTVARLGGDEFIILLENVAQPNDAAVVSENVISALTKTFQISKCDSILIGTSIGISLYPQNGESAMTLISNADAALYEAKYEGRGRFVYFSEVRSTI